MTSILLKNLIYITLSIETYYHSSERNTMPLTKGFTSTFDLMKPSSLSKLLHFIFCNSHSTHKMSRFLPNIPRAFIFWNTVICHSTCWINVSPEIPQKLHISRHDGRPLGMYGNFISHALVRYHRNPTSFRKTLPECVLYRFEEHIAGPFPNEGLDKWYRWFLWQDVESF